MNALVLTLLLVTAPPRSAADVPGGKLEVEGGTLPLLSSDAEIDVSGDIATAKITQTFENDRKTALHARYLFPLPHDAAVFAMTMTVGKEIVRAQIQKVEEAKATFEKAKREGHTASLLEQHRPNVFTQDVANIPPGEAVRITIEYAQSVPREDGRYRLHLPMVVASRYDNGANGVAVPGLDRPLPAAARHETDPRKSGVANQTRRVTVRVRLDAGLPIRTLSSPSHAIEVDQRGPSRREVVLAGGRVVDDRDFVLEYALDGAKVGAGLLTHKDERGGFFTLLLEPPAAVGDEEVRARELVFVVDASCSMDGTPLETSKALINRMLDQIKPRDTYRVIVFGSSASELERKPLSPTPENVERTKRKLAALGTMGGTEIELGIRAALEPPVPDGRLRIVVFLTDAFIGSEASVMATIDATRGEARIMSFGIGESVNRWLIEEMAIAGRGVARIVGLTEDQEKVVADFAARLERPFLTDAWIDWGDLDVTELVPAGLIDLYAGAPVRVLGRLPEKGFPRRFSPALVGTLGGKTVRIPIQVTELDAPSGAIPVLWARAKIAEHTRAVARPGQSQKERDHFVDAITRLGLEFAITTQWTAFVAVAERVVEAPASSEEIAFGAPKGLKPMTAPEPAVFSGASTPEPHEWAIMLCLIALAAWALRAQDDGARSRWSSRR